MEADLTANDTYIYEEPCGCVTSVIMTTTPDLARQLGGWSRRKPPGKISMVRKEVAIQRLNINYPKEHLHLKEATVPTGKTPETAKIRPFSYEDKLTGNRVAVTVSERFSMIHVNNRVYYFVRQTGKFDGTSIQVDQENS